MFVTNKNIMDSQKFIRTVKDLTEEMLERERTENQRYVSELAHTEDFEQNINDIASDIAKRLKTAIDDYVETREQYRRERVGCIREAISQYLTDNTE